MNASSVDIKEMLEDFGDSSGISVTFGSNLFIGLEPDKPDNCVTIFDTPSMTPQLTLEGTAQYEYPSVQIRVRNNNYVTGWALINDIKNALHGRAQETWNSTLYSVIYVSSGPAMLDWDENGRVRFILNLNIQRR